jgi:hypothetical protein
LRWKIKKGKDWKRNSNNLLAITKLFLKNIKITHYKKENNSKRLNLTDEKLLEFFVAVVDTKLLETVAGENLEAVDVENADDGGVGNIGLRSGGVNGWVDLAHNPGEQPVIQRLNKGAHAPEDGLRVVLTENPTRRGSVLSLKEQCHEIFGLRFFSQTNSPGLT